MADESKIWDLVRDELSDADVVDSSGVNDMKAEKIGSLVRRITELVDDTEAEAFNRGVAAAGD